MPLNVQCKRCANLRNDWCDKKHDSPDPDLIRDCQYYRTKTHSDRIRAMTDEELAWAYAYRLASCYGCEASTIEDCVKCTLDWLRQEVEE